jgi:hypothetical protein
MTLEKMLSDTYNHLEHMTMQEAREHVMQAYTSRKSLIIAGLISGCTVAALFNPWDRALYLAQLHRRPFLRRENFQNPYKGIWQVVFHRTLSNGLFFPLFDLFRPAIEGMMARSNTLPGLAPDARDALVHFLAGNTAGGLSGAITNHFTAIKYASWDSKYGFLRTSWRMWREGGIHPFVKGVMVTIARETVWGGAFALIKFSATKALTTPTDSTSARRAKAFVASLIGGSVATVLSSPLNYARNMKYGTPASERPKSTPAILRELWKQTKEKKGTAARIYFLQNELRIGWGTARVAVGMAVAAELYEFAKNRIDQIEKEHKLNKVIAKAGQPPPQQQLQQSPLLPAAQQQAPVSAAPAGSAKEGVVR